MYPVTVRLPVFSKVSLQKILALWLCVLVLNSTTSCWAHISNLLHSTDGQGLSEQAQPWQALSRQVLPCHAAMNQFAKPQKESTPLPAGQATVPSGPIAFSHAPIAKPASAVHYLNHTAHTKQADTHWNPVHQCMLNCSAVNLASNLPALYPLAGSMLPASKPFYRTIAPQQAWRRDLERPPQFPV